MEYVVPVLVLALVVASIAVVVRQVRIVTIHDWERGLRFRQGRLAGLVNPGVHVTFHPLSEIQPLDMRASATPVDGQEVLTSDGVAAKVSLVARYVVSDPVAAITTDTAYGRTVYLWLQVALRDAITRRTLDQAIADRGVMGAEIKEAAAGRIATLGVDLLEVEVRDVMLPGELKRSFAAVIVARKEGEAALERARAETAALRSLANAGRTVADNPGLLQLRILQELGASSGNTVVFGAPDGMAPWQTGSGPAPSPQGTSPQGTSPQAPAPQGTARPAPSASPGPTRRTRPTTGG